MDDCLASRRDSHVKPQKIITFKLKNVLNIIIINNNRNSNNHHR